MKKIFVIILIIFGFSKNLVAQQYQHFGRHQPGCTDVCILLLQGGKEFAGAAVNSIRTKCRQIKERLNRSRRSRLDRVMPQHLYEISPYSIFVPSEEQNLRKRDNS